VPEIHNKPYIPKSGAHRIIVQQKIPVADLTLNVNYYSQPADFTGMSRQAFKAVLDSASAPTAQIEFMVQEYLDGSWVEKGGLIPATVGVGEVAEHHSEDVMRLARIRIKPLTALPTVGVWLEISGKRWL